MRPADPPRLPLALLRALLSRAERDEIVADVAEEYAERLASEGRVAARRWLWRQALGSAPALLGWSWWREWSGFEPGANAYRPGGPMLRSWITDARYAGRRLRARPGYTLLAVLTLALGVGGTAAVFGIVRAMLLEPLPYAHEREVGVFWKKTDWSEEEFLHIRGRVPGFRQVALYRHRDLRLRQGDAPARLLPGLSASAELFDVLGARTMLGRGLRAGDDVEGAEPVAVLSFGLWQEMGGDPSIVGTRLTLDGRPRTVVGVMPRGFWFPDPSVRIWTQEGLSTEGWTYNSTLVGRVAPGFDLHAMTAPVARLTSMLDERFDYPAQWDKAKDAQIKPIRDDLMGGMRPALLATLGAMALILLIACANVAALMLGQVDARVAELAVRLALGANRRRLTQQLVAESMLLAAAAGMLGTGLAWGGFRVLTRALPLGAWTEVTAPDWTLFASAMGIAVAAALLVALVPTVSLWRRDLRGVLGTARTGGLQGRGGRLENGLVVAEVALAVLVASGAALLARSVANLYGLDAGVRAERVGVLDVMLGPGLSLERQRQTVEQLTAALAELPGVELAAAAQKLPLRDGGYNVPISIEGRTDLQGMTTEYRIVTPGYLETMGFALLSGRTISESDRSDTERVVVINEALVEKYFAGGDPIGQRLGGDAEFARVIGVVANAAERRLTDDAVPVRYVAVAQMPWVDEAQSLVLQAAPGTDPAALLGAARDTLERDAPAVAVRTATTMSRVH
ncbi:MAG: ABC transporter permease, partial [Longimicrobiales bacterium]